MADHGWGTGAEYSHGEHEHGAGAAGHSGRVPGHVHTAHEHGAVTAAREGDAREHGATLAATTGHDGGDAHGHAHEHGAAGHAGHAHGVAQDADHTWLAVALGLIVVYMAAEVVAGIAASSLALLSDAAHMLTDAASIVLALVAMRLAARPATGRFTYGLKRAEILSAQANGLTLLLLGVWLAVEAVRRLFAPPEVAGGLMLATALVGIVVNIAATWCISRANRTSLNVEGAYQHILNDLFAFIGTAVAALIVLTTGFARADAIATLLVVALMTRAGLGLLRDSGRIFLEAAPADIDPAAVGDAMAAVEPVTEVHDLHVWQITSGQAALSAHVLVRPDGDCHQTRRDIGALLSQRWGITHTTLQVDHSGRGGSSRAGEFHGHCEDPHGPVHTQAPHEH